MQNLNNLVKNPLLHENIKNQADYNQSIPYRHLKCLYGDLLLA